MVCPAADRRGSPGSAARGAAGGVTRDWSPLLASARVVRDGDLPVAAGRASAAGGATRAAGAARARDRRPGGGAAQAPGRTVLGGRACEPVRTGRGVVPADRDEAGAGGPVGVGGGPGRRRGVCPLPARGLR